MFNAFYFTFRFHLFPESVEKIKNEHIRKQQPQGNEQKRKNQGRTAHFQMSPSPAEKYECLIDADGTGSTNIFLIFNPRLLRFGLGRGERKSCRTVLQYSGFSECQDEKEIF
ncbi:MAG: hypothetical protein IJS01_03180 [Lentisphaeria bacterium]|nr:hypothetical protein [Lentisphaeria bacterium]